MVVDWANLLITGIVYLIIIYFIHSGIKWLIKRDKKRFNKEEEKFKQ